MSRVSGSRVRGPRISSSRCEQPGRDPPGPEECEAGVRSWPGDGAFLYEVLGSFLRLHSGCRVARVHAEIGGRIVCCLALVHQLGDLFCEREVRERRAGRALQPLFDRIEIRSRAGPPCCRGGGAPCSPGRGPPRHRCRSPHRSSGGTRSSSRSMSRNRSSPSSSKMDGIDRPVVCSMRASVSMNGTVDCRARILPISVFPVPRKPVKTILFIPCKPPQASPRTPGTICSRIPHLSIVIPPMPQPSTAKLIAVR